MRKNKKRNEILLKERIQELNTQNSYNKKQIVWLIISNIFALIAIMISIANFLYNYTKDKKQNTELITFEPIDLKGNYITHFSKCGINENFAGFYTKKYDIIVSNNSAKDIAITKLESRISFSENSFMYNTINKGIDLPLNIDAHKSERVRIELRFPINQKAYDILLKYYDENSYQKYDDFIRTLHLNQLDIIGNSIDYKEYEKDSYIMMKKEQKEQYETEVFFTTSEKNIFSCFIIPND